MLKSTHLYAVCIIVYVNSKTRVTIIRSVPYAVLVIAVSSMFCAFKARSALYTICG